MLFILLWKGMFALAFLCFLGFAEILLIPDTPI
jgi:hypothetical protein